MQQAHFFVGIDGGGSKTQLRLESFEGKILAETFAGPGNIRLSVEKAFQSIQNAFNLALQQAQVPPHAQFHVGMGLAGFEVSSSREDFLKKQRNFHFASVEIQSDAHIACLGAHGGHDGAVIIAGTGVVGLAMLRKKKIQVGGWGFPHGDEGSAAWIGLEAMRCALHFCDGRQKKSPLLFFLKKKFGGRAEHLTQWACEAHATQYAELARIVFYYAQKRDIVAVSLLKAAAKEVEKIFEILSMKHKKNVFPCAFVGGVAPFIKKYLKKSIQKKFVFPWGDPCQGALLMIRKKYAQK
jgi:glucosamine kinase